LEPESRGSRSDGLEASCFSQIALWVSVEPPGAWASISGRGIKGRSCPIWLKLVGCLSGRDRVLVRDGDHHGLEHMSAPFLFAHRAFGRSALGGRSACGGRKGQKEGQPTKGFPCLPQAGRISTPRLGREVTGQAGGSYPSLPLFLGFGSESPKKALAGHLPHHPPQFLEVIWR